MNLEQAVAIAPFMQDFYDEDITVVISGLHSVLVAINHENLNLGVHKDEKTNETAFTFRCLREQKRLVMRVSKAESKFGSSYIAIANPLWNNGELEGAMTVVISRKRDDALISNASSESAREGHRGRSFALMSEELIEVDLSEEFNQI